MFGVPIYGPTNIFCDNGAICVNAVRTESNLKKKHHSIVYYCRREAVPSGKVRVSKNHIMNNLDDVFSKTMAEPRREGFGDHFAHSEGKIKSVV